MAGMRTRDEARRVTRGGLVLLVLMTLATSYPVHAEVTNPPAERFRSSFEFGFDMEMEERDITVRGTVPTRDAEDEFSSAVFRLGWRGEFAPVDRVWGRPRPFARGGLRWTRLETNTGLGNYKASEPDDTLSRALALEVSGAPGRVQRNQRLREGIFTTQRPGAGQTVAQIDYRNGPVPGYYAGLGLTFEEKVPGDEFPGWVSFSTSLEWSMRRYSLRGGATSYEITAEADPVQPRPQNEAPLPPGTTFPSVYEVLHQTDTFSFWQHRVGPSFEVEAGLRSRERFALSVFFATRLQFLASRAIHTWGDPNGLTKTEYDRMVEPIATPTPLDPTGEVVRFRSQSDSMILSVGGGIRFHWF